MSDSTAGHLARVWVGIRDLILAAVWVFVLVRAVCTVQPLPTCQAAGVRARQQLHASFTVWREVSALRAAWHTTAASAATAGRRRLQLRLSSLEWCISGWRAVQTAAAAAREQRCELALQRSRSRRLRIAATMWRDVAAAAANFRAAASHGCVAVKRRRSCWEWARHLSP